MHTDAMLTQLGYSPNEALKEQLRKIEANTAGYEKIKKHIMDLHDHLKVNNSYVALSNSNDYFKIKIEAIGEEFIEEAHKKIQHFSEKFKIKLSKVEDKETYYIIGFENN